MVHASYNHNQKDPIETEKHGDVYHMKNIDVSLVLSVEVYKYIVPRIIILNKMTDAILAFMNRYNGLRVRKKASQCSDNQARYDADLRSPPDQSLLI